MDIKLFSQLQKQEGIELKVPSEFSNLGPQIGSIFCRIVQIIKTIILLF